MKEETRVEKYQKLRQEISLMDTYRFDSPFQDPLIAASETNDEKDMAMSSETLKNEHIKKNTLSISIDQLIKAHDEYTVMISKEEIEQQKEEELKANKILKRKKMIGIIAIVGVVAVFAILLAIVLFLIFR